MKNTEQHNRRLLRKEYTRNFYRGNRLRLAAICARLILDSLAAIMMAWLMQQLFDTIMSIPGSMPLNLLWKFFAALVLIIILVNIIDYLSTPKFLAKAMEQYKNYVYRKLSQKSISAFSSENTSLYLSALSNDANIIEQEYLPKLFRTITSVITLIGALALMLFYSPLLTLVSIALSLLPIMLSVLVGNRMAGAEKAVSEANSGFMDGLKDSLTGFSVIKAFRAEASVFRQFAANVRRVAKAKCRRDQIQIIIGGLDSIAYIITQCGVFLFGAWMVLSNKGVSAGILISFVQMMNYVLQPINVLPDFFAKRKAAFALIDKLAAALEQNVRDEGSPLPQPLKHGITLENVSFSYGGEKNALEHISCRFEAGKSYAIVGGSGSGKSTLLNLLMAGYQTYSGEICYDDAELRTINSESLYDTVSLIQQSVFIFNNSVRDNVTMFGQFADADVDRALTMSGLDAFIAQRGADTLCGENGCNLSGGERQRISIARSLLRKSSVLLMDEATAALDTQTAHQVTHAILDQADLTRIIVTHRLEAAALERFDRILTLKNGRIVESGTFRELMEQTGYFYSLYNIAQ